MLAEGASAPLIRLAGAPAITAAFLRTLIGGATLMVAVLALRRPLPRGVELRRAAAAGVVLGAHFALWFSSLQMTTVAASTVLVCTQPVFVAVLAALFLGERTPPQGLFGMAVAIGGSVLIALDGNTGTAPAPHALLGAAFALAGAVVVAFYPILARGQHPSSDPLAFSAIVALCAAGILAALALVVDQPLVTSDIHWPALIALALVPTVIGQTALNIALRTLPAALVAGAILGEPLIATLVALPVLDETPGPLTAAGSLFTLVGLSFLLARRPAAHRKPELMRAGERTG
jgi:drug/metabolite transporter (DMT)-like permease